MSVDVTRKPSVLLKSDSLKSENADEVILSQTQPLKHYTLHKPYVGVISGHRNLNTILKKQTPTERCVTQTIPNRYTSREQQFYAVLQ